MIGFVIIVPHMMPAKIVVIILIKYPPAYFGEKRALKLQMLSKNIYYGKTIFRTAPFFGKMPVVT